MTPLPPQVCWPLERLGEALECLARVGGLPLRTTGLVSPAPQIVQPGGIALARWVEGAASWLGLEAEYIETRYKDVDHLLRNSSPALLRLLGPEPRFVVLVGAHRDQVRLFTLSNEVLEVDREVVRSAFCEIVETPLRSAVELALDSADVPAPQRPTARRALLREQLGGSVLRACWLLRRSPHEGLLGHLVHARLGRQLAVLLLTRAAEYVLLLLGWWVVGGSILSSHLELSLLVAWVLLLLSALPLRMVSTWLAGLLGVELGCLLKQRLLSGALLMEPSEIRREGAGRLLGRVLEADALESLTVGGGLSGLIAVVELVMAACVLGLGPRGGMLILGLIAWVGLTALLAMHYLRRRLQWTRARLEMTNALVEKMTGHRTRVAQEAPARWHEGDDLAVERYLGFSRPLDQVRAWMLALVPRGWLVVGIMVLGPVLAGGEFRPPEVALALGGVLLAFRAFRILVTGGADLMDAAAAWEQVAPLQRTTARAEVATQAALAALSRQAGAAPGMVLDAQSLIFGHSGRPIPVLRDCSLEIRPGDRILLEGTSGSGKSSLGALLSGLRTPSHGLLLLNGLDRATLGLAGWRRHVASSPQFHENHVLSAPLAFNLLLGRQWPPRPVDLDEAEEICRELGLGALLDRMPGGMMQMVGETGWQLSHGEKSRIYIARALLQEADLVILDESFAALDPATLQQALRCVMERAPTLLLIAHP